MLFRISEASSRCLIKTQSHQHPFESASPGIAKSNIAIAGRVGYWKKGGGGRSSFKKSRRPRASPDMQQSAGFLVAGLERSAKACGVGSAHDLYHHIIPMPAKRNIRLFIATMAAIALVGLGYAAWRWNDRRADR